VDQLAESVVGVSILGGDLAEGTSLQEVRSQGFIATVKGTIGLLEVAQAGGVVHGVTSKNVREFRVGSLSPIVLILAHETKPELLERVSGVVKMGAEHNPFGNTRKDAQPKE
jgi:hypothetical protein